MEMLYCIILMKIFFSVSSYGDRSFLACAPTLWNPLPINIRETTSLEQLKKQNKTKNKNKNKNC